MKNIADAITFACGGMPRVAETYTNFRKVVNCPELKFVMMSSNDSENASNPAAAIPGATSGRVIRRKASPHWRRVHRACSRRGQAGQTHLHGHHDKLMQNGVCASTTVEAQGHDQVQEQRQQRGTEHDLGVAIGRKISRFVVDRPGTGSGPVRKRSGVPKMVETTVTIKPTTREFTTEGRPPGAPQGLSQLSHVKLFHTMFVRPASLNEKANVCHRQQQVHERDDGVDAQRVVAHPCAARSRWVNGP